MVSRASPPSVMGQVKDVFPKLGELTEKVLFGDVWERPGLAKRDRSLITLAALIALHRPEQLKGHLWRALDNGVKREEIVASAGIVAGLQELAEALRNQYAVSFSRSDRPKDNEKLSVSVKRSGLTVRAPVKLRAQ